MGCHLWGCTKLDTIEATAAAAAAKYRGLEACRYTFFYKRKLKAVNFLNINLNLTKLNMDIHMDIQMSI